MRYLLLAIVPLLGGCVGAQVRASGHVSAEFGSPAIAMVSDDPLSEALTSELLDCGFRVIERTRLVNVMEEHHLSFTGILEKENAELLGKVLNVNLLVFSKLLGAAYFGDRIQSATVKLVDVKTAEVMVAVNYTNGGGGAPGSPADASMKEKVPDSARRIARELAPKFNRTCRSSVY